MQSYAVRNDTDCAMPASSFCRTPSFHSNLKKGRSRQGIRTFQSTSREPRPCAALGLQRRHRKQLGLSKEALWKPLECLKADKDAVSGGAENFFFLLLFFSFGRGGCVCVRERERASEHTRGFGFVSCSFRGQRGVRERKAESFSLFCDIARVCSIYRLVIAPLSRNIQF